MGRKHCSPFSHRQKCFLSLFIVMSQRERAVGGLCHFLVTLCTCLHQHPLCSVSFSGSRVLSGLPVDGAHSHQGRNDTLFLSLSDSESRILDVGYQWCHNAVHAMKRLSSSVPASRPLPHGATQCRGSLERRVARH